VSHLAIDLSYALALLAMVMGEQYPLDMLHAESTQMIKDSTIAQVDQQGGVAVTKKVTVASIRKSKELGEALGIRLDEF
jgi:hypothetical protein